MTLQKFLERTSLPNSFFDTPLTVVTCSAYPAIFVATVMQRLKKTHGAAFVSIDLAVHDLAAISSQLQMSFLGQRSLFWLKNCDELADKDKKKFIAFLSDYAGPHSIICVAEQLPSSWAEAEHCALPMTVDKQLFIQLIDIEQPGLSRKATTLINALFERTDSLSLDQVYALMRYCMLVGTSQEQFARQWLDALVVPEKSLFTLSTYFFAKDARNFFILWATLHEEYADTFWITFWSEQIWRACNVIRLMQQQQFAQAKALSYRLPFSFMQRDWKKITPVELQRAHASLYAMDYQLKTGGSAALDVLYSKFMLGQFKV